MKRDRRRSQKPADQVKIARQRIDMLAKQAVDVRKERPDLSRRYYQLARKIGMRYNVRIPREIKRKFCKHCFSYLGEGWRFGKGRMKITCRECGKIMRYPYKPRTTKK